MNTWQVAAAAAVGSCLLAGTVVADITTDYSVTVRYTVDLGGRNSEPLNGLSAQATFDISGTKLTILLRNTSSGVPESFDVSDSLLVSIGLNLGNVWIVSGDSAVVGPASTGLGAWSGLRFGDSVAEEWAWTNDGGGDFLESYANVLSTSNGFGGGDHFTFDGKLNGNVGGPFGGIASDPPQRDVPKGQPAVSDSILFALTLSEEITPERLTRIVRNSVVEFGSDQRYLGVPAPAAIGLLGIAGLLTRRRRRSP